VDRLPHWGHYKAALAQDEVWAEHLADLEEAGRLVRPDPEDGPSLVDYDPIVARLELIADRVLAVRTAVQANYTKNHEEPRFTPLPRPVTAMDRVQERRARTVLSEVDALVRGDGLVVGDN
jgi:hypothetical protein